MHCRQKNGPRFFAGLTAVCVTCILAVTAVVPPFALSLPEGGTGLE